MWRRIMNEQTHLVTIILTPILLFILTTLPWMIKLLLSTEFMGITDFVSFFNSWNFFTRPNLDFRGDDCGKIRFKNKNVFRTFW